MNFTLIKKAVLKTLAVMLMFTAGMYAQDRVAEGAKKVADNMKTQLTLNEGQYAKVLDINKVYLQKAKETNKTGVTKVEKAKKLKALDDERETKLKSVLTEDQFKIYAAGRVENKKKLKEYLEDKKS